MSNHFPLGPRYLHDTSEVREVLHFLKIEVKPIEIKVGYHDGLSYVEGSLKGFREKYYMKSRGVDTLDGFNGTTMNSNKSSFKALDIDFPDFIRKLSSKVKWIPSKVSSLDSKNKIITIETDEGTQTKYYDELISTIPLYNLQLMLGGIKVQTKGETMTYVVLEKEFLDLVQIARTELDFIYYIGNCPFHRITQDKKDKSKIVVDILGAKNKDELVEQFHAFYVNHQVVPYAQLIEDNRNEIDQYLSELKENGITCIGRFGTHNRKWKSETVAEFARDWRDKKKFK